jgi:predicted acetyltransferase
MKHSFKVEETRALFDDQMRATMTLLPFQLYVGGAVIPMGGIASVASVPENRRSGYVAQLLTRSVREMKEQGVPLSGLYPFNQEFYRRLGWDVACAEIAHVFPPEKLHRFRKYPGVIQRYVPDDLDWAALEDIYARWAQLRLGYMVRGNRSHWEQWVGSVYMRYQAHSAIWRPEPGARPEGYLLYWFKEDEPGKRTLVVRELVALSVAAERALLGFIGNHDSQVRSIRMLTHRDYPVWHLLDDLRDVESTLFSRWMLRLVDLKAAFAARPWPADAVGTLTIAVQDDQAPWNQSTWRVQFEAGHAAVTAAPAETPALSASVQTWAQLYAGFVSPADAVATGRLAGSDPGAVALLVRATAGGSLHFFEYF